MRVKVYDGTGQHFLGYGDLVGQADVHVIVMPNGSLQSLQNAEQEPTEDLVPEGGIVKKIKNNPKIQMDDGSVKYGCQVWWEALKETVQVVDNDGYDPWAVSEN